VGGIATASRDVACGTELAETSTLRHADLADVPVDHNGLVDSGLFDQQRGGFARGDSVFELMSSIPSRNSSYWTLRSLLSFQEAVKAKIRLDPFMRSAREGYKYMFFKMLVFGRPLTWNTIRPRAS